MKQRAGMAVWLTNNVLFFFLMFICLDVLDTCQATYNWQRKNEECRDLPFMEITIAPVCIDWKISSMGSCFQQMKHELGNVFASVPADGKINHTVVVIPNAVNLNNAAMRAGEMKTSISDITMANHLGIRGKLNRFLAQVQRWGGPVSTALFINADYEEQLDQLESFVSRNYNELQKVAFHLYIEKSSHWDKATTKAQREKVARYSALQYPYPNNYLRNLALDNVKTDYFFLADVDFITAPINTHKYIKSIIQTNEEIRNHLRNRTMFVLPALEMTDKIFADEDIEDEEGRKLFPNDKEMAKRMRKEGQLWQFSKDIFPNGHNPTNFSKWWNMDMVDQSSLSYSISFEQGFEPYVVGYKGNDIPSYFNPFRGFGLDKLSWFSEIHFAGFQFKVFRDVFTFHVTHIRTYDHETHQKNRETNIRCKGDFLKGLRKKYDVANVDRTLWEWWMAL